MATVDSDSCTDIFLSEVETARVRLKEVVSEMRASLQQREEELCVELDRLEREHRDRVSEYRDKLTSLTAIQAGIEEQFKSGEFADLRKSFLSDTNKKIEELERDYPPHSVEVVWEGGLVEKVKGMGNIVVSVGKSVKKCEMEEVLVENEIVIEVLDVEAKRSGFVEESVEKPLPIGVVDYRLRTKPVTTLGHPQLCCQFPQGIAYDANENSVHFVDYLLCNLYTLNLDTKNILTATLYNEPKSKISLSTQNCGICLSNGVFYVSGLSKITRFCKKSLQHVVFSFKVEIKSDIFSSIRSSVSGINSIFTDHSLTTENEYLNSLTGITKDGDNLFVCTNNTINVYTCADYLYKTEIVVKHLRTITDPDLYLPLDVKVHEKRIFVLNSKPPYVLEFDHTGFRRDAFLSHSIVSNFVPSFFCIDRAGRFLISDKRQPYVYVLRRERSAAVEARLELEHGEDPLVEPRGVCLDGEGRVIVLCNYRQALLQIF